jgi:hypothetical protein
MGQHLKHQWQEYSFTYMCGIIAAVRWRLANGERRNASRTVADSRTVNGTVIPSGEAGWLVLLLIK